MNDIEYTDLSDEGYELLGVVMEALDGAETSVGIEALTACLAEVLSQVSPDLEQAIRVSQLVCKSVEMSVRKMDAMGVCAWNGQIH
jgi:hypothetical protein